MCATIVSASFLEPKECKDNTLQSFALETICPLVTMVKGRFAINDELRLLIYITASKSLSARTFSHLTCGLDMLQVIQNLEPFLT